MRMAAIEEIVHHLVKTRFEDIPVETVERQKDLLIDTLGVTVAGAKAPGVREVIELLRETGGKEESTVLAYGERFPSFHATMANTFMAHALDFDDMHERGGVHANVSVIPASLAIAEKVGGANGKSFLTAIILGVDLICRMAVSIPLSRGWHPTATLGIFGATVASSKILGLNEKKMANGLGIAYSQSSGNRQGRLEGTLTKRLQVALAAKTGVLCSLFAQRGLTGPKEILEGDWGMFRLYTTPPSPGHQGKILESLMRDLGKTFLGDELSIKPYPSCKATHTSIYGVLNLLKEERIRPEEIDGVDIFVSEGCYQTAGRPFEIRTDPQVDGQFSIPYTVATAILTGGVSLEDFTESAFKDHRRLAMAKKVKVSIDPDLREPSTKVVNLESRIVIRAKGRESSFRSRICKGHPESPMSREEIFSKFESCLRFGDPLLSERAREAFNKILNLERVEDVCTITGLLC
jgi:2-methylcitrate dehydratase PrpD